MPKDYQINIRLSAEDRQYLVDKAQEAGCTLTDLILSSVRRRPIENTNLIRERIVALRGRAAELSRMAANINQIAFRLNTIQKNRLHVSEKEAQELLQALAAANEIREKELGLLIKIWQ